MRPVLGLFFAAALGFGQKEGCGLAHPGECLKDVVNDQAGIWTSPLQVKKKDATWLVPLALSTALAFHFDTQAENALGNNAKLTKCSMEVARFGSPYATAGGGAALYLVGIGLKDKHLAETGRLGVEALIDASLVVGALKLATDRERLNNGQSGFWPNGASSFVVNSSFPSGHAAASWALARVIASEYPKNKPLRVAVYAFATAISVCRITGKAHFPSDVVVGSALGYLIGGYVTRHHAEPLN